MGNPTSVGNTQPPAAEPNRAREASAASAEGGASATGSPRSPFLSGLDRRLRTGAFADGSESEALRQAQVRRLLEPGIAVEAIHSVVALLTYLALSSSLPSGALTLWLGAVVVLAGARFLVRRRLLARKVAPARTLTIIRAFAIVIGLSWGAGALVFHETLSSNQFFLLMMVFAGIVAGATSSLVMDRRSFVGLSGGIMGSLVLAIALRDSMDAQGVLLTMAVLFFVGMQVLYTRAHGAMVEAILTSVRLKGAERANVRERAFLDALIASAPTAIGAVDADGRVLGVNPAFERLFGYHHTDVIGRTLDDLVVPPEQRSTASRLFDRVRAGEVFHEDLERCRADGTRVPVRVSAAPVLDAEERAVFVLYDDRSSEVEANEALREAERHYRQLVESSSDLVWTMDRKGVWTFVNSACLEIYGIEPAELVGTPMEDRVAEEQRALDVAMLRTVLSGNEVSDYETVHRDVDGQTKHLSFSARPNRTQAGEIVGARGTARDVSERAAIRSALEEARELALNAAQAKSGFLANMSHEIRTPMNGVLGMLEVLLDTNLDAEQRRAAEVIRSSGQALLTLIDEILDFSKLESGNIELEEIPFDLKGMVDATIRLLGVEAEKKGLELIGRFDPTLPERAIGDPGRIRQVLTNLAGNAVKFTHSGQIVIEVARGGSDLPVDAVKFAVRDTGIGIPTGKLPTIFDQFTQADVSTTRRYGGTGLGLSICRGLVERMGGRIAVSSVESEGSEFSFWMPLPPAEPEPKSPEAPTLVGLRALVVDDSAVNRRVLTESLAAAQILVDAVGAPEAALQRLRQAAQAGTPYGLAVVDRQMPELDGFAFARLVRNDPALADLPLVLLTSGPDQGDGKLCRALGIGGYLHKPVGRADLLEAISRMLRAPDTAEEPKLITRHTISEARRSLSLLLVEDNPLNQEVAVALLERRGHRVEVVDNGLDALDAAVNGGFDLVLMDIQLPGIDGVEATRRIRRILGPEELPIVALTAHAFEEERERALASGMNAFLSKPFRPHDLFAAVEGWAKPPVAPKATETSASSGRPGASATSAETARAKDADDFRNEPDGSPPADLEAFREEMREVGIEHIVDETVTMFRADLSERLLAIVDAQERSDIEEVKRLAHALKSGAGTVHATGLQAALETLEACARGDSPMGLAEAAEYAVRRGREVLAYLESVMKPAGAARELAPRD